MTAQPQKAAFDEARDQARQARGAGGDLSLLCEIAALHLMHGRSAQAEHLVRAALWIDPTSGHAQRLLGHALARNGRPVEAARAMIAAGRANDVRLSARDWRAIGAAMLTQGHKDLGSKFLFRRS